ncbi:MAG: HD domain-containing protein [Deltaproteobacteria bacterium]
MATDDAGLLGERFEQALVYAARLHARQTRKAKTTPYISHLMAVASMVLECGGDEDEAISALLHDAAEDQGGQRILDEIGARFGASVAGIVAECSDSLIDAGAADKQPWRERKETFVERLRTASPSCRLVTACDKLHNIGDVLADHAVHGDTVFERFTGRREGTAWYYREVAGILAADGNRAARELVAASAELDRRLDL